MGSSQYKEPPALSRDYIMNPYSARIQGPDQSAERAAMMRDWARRAGQARQQALALNNQMLGGSRSSSSGLISDIAAQQSYGQQKAQAMLDAKDFAARNQLMQAWNQAINDANAARIADYQNMLGMNRLKRMEEQQNLANILGAIRLGGSAAAGQWGGM
jgi:Lon protease-like protein